MNAKQTAFVMEYAKNGNATQAALRAGYSPKTAYAQGSALLKQPEISESVKKLVNSRLAKQEITAQEVVTELANRLRLDPTVFFDETGKVKPLKELPIEARRCIDGFDCWVDPLGQTHIKLRLWAKGDAMGHLLKALKIGAPDQMPERQVLIQFLNVPPPKYAQVVEGEIAQSSLEPGKTVQD